MILTSKIISTRTGYIDDLKMITYPDNNTVIVELNKEENIREVFYVPCAKSFRIRFNQFYDGWDISGHISRENLSQGNIIDLLEVLSIDNASTASYFENFGAFQARYSLFVMSAPKRVVDYYRNYYNNKEGE